MKKLVIMLLVILVSFPCYCFAHSAAEHIRFYQRMEDVSTFFGGLGGKLDEKQLTEIQHAIDGTKGIYHRDDLSHDVKTLTKMIMEKNPNWDKKAIENVIKNHDVADMYHSGSQGVNGWEADSKKRAQAEKLFKKIQKGERIYWWPSWVSKRGPGLKPNTTKVQESVNKAKIIKSIENLFRYGPVKTIFSISKKTVPYLPYLVVVYETGKIALVVVEESELHVKQIIELGPAWTGGVVGALAGGAIALKVCAPLNSIPTIGPVVYGASVLTISLACAYGGEKIAEFVIDGLYSANEPLFPEQIYEVYGVKIFMYEV